MEQWNPLSKRVAGRIERIATEGERLPSQRELSQQFGVSRTSVREALSLLEASGKLRTEPGRGSFWVKGPSRSPEEPEPNAAGEPSSLAFYGDYPKSEISRFRYLIEGQSARLASMRITDEEIQQLDRNLATFKMQTRAMDLAASAQTDFEFHQLLVECSGIRLFKDLHLHFKDIIMQAVQMRSIYTRAWEPVVEHEKIVEALRRRDPDEATYYSHSHIVRSAERQGIIDANEIF
jgi:GntR family transcriptional regulator, transcriptional repressor for pyruvate dehydrogenase complex